jgi:hypothetical protein
MSLGSERVRVSFNPSKDNMVDKIKWKTAELIDLMKAMVDETKDPEVGRLLSLAMTYYETAAMYGVKAVTAGPAKIDYPSDELSRAG